VHADAVREEDRLGHEHLVHFGIPDGPSTIRRLFFLLIRLCLLRRARPSARGDQSNCEVKPLPAMLPPIRRPIRSGVYAFALLAFVAPVLGAAALTLGGAFFGVLRGRLAERGGAGLGTLSGGRYAISERRAPGTPVWFFEALVLGALSRIADGVDEFRAGPELLLHGAERVEAQGFAFETCARPLLAALMRARPRGRRREFLDSGDELRLSPKVSLTRLRGFSWLFVLRGTR
jgi:hypothetical protein